MKDVKVDLYTRIDGIPTFKNSDIFGIYNKIVEQNLDSLVFSDGTINSGRDFLNMLYTTNTILFVITYKNKKVGITWLNRFQGKKAQIHFCFFKEMHGRPKLIQIGEFALNKILNWKYSDNNEYFVDVLIGYIPVWNKAANKFMTKINATKVGIIPNSKWHSIEGSEHAIFYYATRESIKE